MEGEQIGLASGAAGIQDGGNLPAALRGGSDEEAVHGPVMVLAQGDAIGGVVIAAVEGIAEGDEVRGIDEGEVVPLGQADAQAAGGALEVVGLQHDPAEAGGAPRALVVLPRAIGGLEEVFIPVVLRLDQAFRDLVLDEEQAEGRTCLREVAGDEGLPQSQPVVGREKPHGRSTGDGGPDVFPGHVTHEGCALQGDDARRGAPHRMPPAFLPEVEEGILRGVLIIAATHDLEVSCETLPQAAAPEDAVRRRLAHGNEIEHGEEQEGLVRALMALRPFPDDTDMQRIQHLDGVVEGAGAVGRHGRRMSRAVSEASRRECHRALRGMSRLKAGLQNPSAGTALRASTIDDRR